jgi:hypothetical protein
VALLGVEGRGAEVIAQEHLASLLQVLAELRPVLASRDIFLCLFPHPLLLEALLSPCCFDQPTSSMPKRSM